MCGGSIGTAQSQQRQRQQQQLQLRLHACNGHAPRNNNIWILQQRNQKASKGPRLVVVPREARVREDVEAHVVRRDRDDRPPVQRDGEVAKEDGQNRHERDDDCRKAGGEVGDAGGGVGELEEEVEAPVEEGALARPEHLEVALGPAGALLERLLRDRGRLADGEVLLQGRTAQE